MQRGENRRVAVMAVVDIRSQSCTTRLAHSLTQVLPQTHRQAMKARGASVSRNILQESCCRD